MVHGHVTKLSSHRPELISELSANAVTHTASGDGGTFEVCIDLRPRAVRVEVRDLGSRYVPVVRKQDGLLEAGRGPRP